MKYTFNETLEILGKAAQVMKLLDEKGIPPKEMLKLSYVYVTTEGTEDANDSDYKKGLRILRAMFDAVFEEGENIDKQEN